MFRPRRMNETISCVSGGVAPLAVAYFSTAGPMPCATGTLPAEADGAAASDDDLNGGSAIAAASAPAASAARRQAAIAAAVGSTRFTEFFSCHR